MKERPILFKDEMVRAILEGQKTQTRRVVKFPHENRLGMWESMTIGGPKGGRLSNGATIPEQAAMGHTRTGDVITSPYGQPGDRLWVRETWVPMTLGYAYRADPIWNNPPANRWHPSIHMPRCASRITLEITGVRVERLQDISEADAIAEGIEKTTSGFWSLYGQADVDGTYSPRASYRSLWEQINGPESWNATPWVWVIEFKRVQS